MSRSGQKLIQAAREALAMACGAAGARGPGRRGEPAIRPHRRHGRPANRPCREAGASRRAPAPAAAGYEAPDGRRPAEAARGTTVAQVCEATGWTKDTVRDFFVGLKKKGIRVETVEKVRSVGLNRTDGRRSYTIYRVAEAGDA